MPVLVSTDELKRTLTEFAKRGEETWVNENELKTEVATQVSEAISGLAGLTQEDIEEIVEEA